MEFVCGGVGSFLLSLCWERKSDADGVAVEFDAILPQGVRNAVCSVQDDADDDDGECRGFTAACSRIAIDDCQVVICLLQPHGQDRMEQTERNYGIQHSVKR